ncbi:MAG: homogentisate 1,2-dioxygenase, partial [Acidobacteriota bacterium]
TRPELPAPLARDALVGLRPARRLDVGTQPPALHAGPLPEQARRIVVALHGRGAEAGTILRRMREIAGHDPGVCVIAPRAEGGADRWYAIKFDDPAAASDPEVERAIARVDTVLDVLARRAPGVPVVLAGFSQGACLALEVAARRAGRGLAGVIAPCGGRIGGGWAAGELRVPVLLGAAAGDRWIPRAALDATAAWLRAAGASVVEVGGPGDRHEISYRQRVEARAIVLAAAPAAATGFGNTHSIEALPGALPPLQNSPRVPPYELYAEQLNATGFTAPQGANQRAWLYRARPSAQRRAFAPLPHATLAASFSGAPAVNLAGFAPLPAPAGEVDFVDGLVTLCGAGAASLHLGYAFHRYAATRSMEARAFYDADGELLILPELGTITLATELGPLEVSPGELALVPRGLVFSVLLHGPLARGYVAETYGRFRLPERGLVGANGLADARHFRAPAPFHEQRLAPGMQIVGKLGGQLAQATQDHSPFDVAAWHGNLAPYAYDLAAFSAVGNTRLDHGDPSIYTVLTSPGLDLIVFPPRIDATTNTFRPPFFHRNAVSEINGIVREQPHPGSVFQPGCCFLTPAATAHGVSRAAVERSRTDTDAPVALGGDSLWFQLEAALPPVIAPWAEPLPDWPATWGSHPSYFG